jgi:hypothetical protein
VAALLVGAAGIALFVPIPGPSRAIPGPVSTATPTLVPVPVIALLMSECAMARSQPGLPTHSRALQACTGSARVIADEPVASLDVWVEFKDENGASFYACRRPLGVQQAPGTVVTWTLLCDPNKDPSGHLVWFTDAEGTDLPSRDDR